MKPKYLSLLTVITEVVAFLPCARAQVNNSGQKPYLGWSSFSQQTIQGNFLTQANMITQSDALKASGLQEHGFVYINLDSGWQGSFDQNGRPIPNSATFPDIKALVDHIHCHWTKYCTALKSTACENFLSPAICYEFKPCSVLCGFGLASSFGCFTLARFC
jgi:hypothetical protein